MRRCACSMRMPGRCFCMVHCARSVCGPSLALCARSCARRRARLDAERPVRRFACAGAALPGFSQLRALPGISWKHPECAGPAVSGRLPKGRAGLLRVLAPAYGLQAFVQPKNFMAVWIAACWVSTVVLLALYIRLARIVKACARHARHAPTHARTHARTRHARTRARAHTHARTHVTRAHTHARTHAHARAHTRVRAHTRTHARTHTQAHKHA